MENRTSKWRCLKNRGQNAVWGVYDHGDQWEKKIQEGQRGQMMQTGQIWWKPVRIYGFGISKFNGDFRDSNFNSIMGAKM